MTLLLCLATLAGCSTHSTYAPVRDRTHAPQSTPGIHVVRSGETLFSIAWQYGLDYQTVAAWNRIRPPYTIYPGQKLGLRGPSARTRSAPPPPKSAAGTPRAPAAPPPASVNRPSAPPPAPQVTGTAVPRWQWPASGQVLRRFDANATGKKGISIAGTDGAEIRAAAGGQVVYAGSGLVGYGRLIIVKHNDNYLSAYGHNRNLLVQEGDPVRAGQVIAHMGSSGTNRTQLHFEIREKGKPVDPLRHLPRR
jgi:lipoprotein NlpD